MSVNLIESGGPRYSPRIQALADTSHFDPRVHAPMSECTRRQIGGTSVIWGGRIVPSDPVDLDERPYISHSRCPIPYEALQPYSSRACDYLRAGRPVFDIHDLPHIGQKSIVPGLPDDDVLSSTLERWSVMNFGVEYAQSLRQSDRIKLVHDLTCVEIEDAAVESHGSQASRRVV